MKTTFITMLFLLAVQNIFAVNHQVSIENFAFNPAELSVAVGDTIEFINLDGAPHNVVPRESSLVQFQSSAILSTGDTFVMDISSDEDILAHCGVHPRMPGIEINVISNRQLLINNIRSQLDQLDQMVD
jgi:plastocyanin